MTPESAKSATPPLIPEPEGNCPLCPRLEGFRNANRVQSPTWHNAPVPSFGSHKARLLIVGLAPGLKGANRTGRPFTGDFAGVLLYQTLIRFGLAEGDYGGHADDGLRLVDCRITNAVRCVPPENKPLAEEIATCRRFLAAEIAGLKMLRVLVALGAVAHTSVVDTLRLKRGTYPFRHGALHALPGGRFLADSYHCSRQNTNTGRLTPAMFEDVFRKALAILSEPSS